MAEARRARHHIHETNALSYGQLGTATYDERQHDWSFLRQYQGQRKLNTNERHFIRHNSPHFQLVDERIFDRLTDASNQNHAVRSQAKNAIGFQNLFLKNIPDAAFASTALSTSASSSDFRNDASMQERPLASTLALGYARLPYEAGMHNNTPAIAIVAVPMGSHKETLRLFGFLARQLAIRNDSGLPQLCTLPFIGRNAVGRWCESAEGILQVSSANQENGTQFLVVKPSGTTILRPALAGTVPEAWVQVGTGADSTSGERLLDPRPAATIPSIKTGGTPQVHAAFNPDDHNTVAIVDVSGQWSVWKLTGSRARSARILYQVHLQGSNDLLLEVKQPSLKSGPLQGDEWHRVSWLAGPEHSMDRILVCNRRIAAVYAQKGGILGLVDMRLGLPSERNVILDIKNSDRRRDHLFVLTTSRLMIFSSTEGSWKEINPVEPLELVCSWNHFRDRADLSLRMSILESSKDSWILVYSAASTFAVMYRFGYESSNSNVVSLEDPSTFHLPQRLKDKIECISDIVLCPVKFSTQRQSFNAVDYGLVKLIGCTNDGVVIEALYKHTLVQSNAAGEQPEGLPTLSLPEISGAFPRSAKYIDEDDLDDFIVSEKTEIENFTEHGYAVSNTAEESRPATFSIRSWERLLEHLAQKEERDDETPWRASLQHAVEKFEHLQRQNGTMCVHLISDLVNDCSITDVEGDSQNLQGWLDNVDVRADIDFESVSFPPAPAESKYHQLLGCYNNLVTTFVQPLSDQLTDRNRVNRERLVRRITGPAVFGTLVLRAKQPIADAETLNLESASISEPAVPYPSPGADSDDQGLSQSSAPEISVASAEPAVARLRQYAAFQYQIPPLLLDHNTGTSTILGHFPASIQENPADYSYQQTNQRMKLVEEQHAAESLDPKQRKKALKSAARLQRKLEKNQLMGQEVMLQRTLLPIIGTGAGVPTLPGREVQSSQAVAPGLSQMTSQGQNAMPVLTMTQPERGAFGTRQTAKKVTKRRAGF